MDGFPVLKYRKKSWLPLSLELKALNIVGYCKALAAIEVVNLLRISSTIDRKRITLVAHEVLKLCCWKYKACLLLAMQITNPSKKKYTCTNPVKKKHMRQLKVNHKLN